MKLKTPSGGRSYHSIKNDRLGTRVTREIGRTEMFGGSLVMTTQTAKIVFKISCCLRTKRKKMFKTISISNNKPIST